MICPTSGKLAALPCDLRVAVGGPRGDSRAGDAACYQCALAIAVLPFAVISCACIGHFVKFVEDTQFYMRSAYA